MNDFLKGFQKTAGGPGSGVSEENTKEIDFLEESPFISIGHRSKFLSANNPVRESEMIPTKKIKYKGQKKYVPAKLKRIIKHKDDALKKPIQVLLDDKGNYHIIDGHHRGLAAIMLRIPRVKADVYVMNSAEKTAEKKEPRKAHDIDSKETSKGREDISQLFIGEESDEPDRYPFMLGLTKPTKGADKRVGLTQQAKSNRPASFQ